MGAQEWARTGSWAVVSGKDMQWLEGRDSAGRAVRCSALGTVVIPEPNPSTATLQKIIFTLSGFDGWRLFAQRLAAIGRVPAVPLAPPAPAPPALALEDGEPEAFPEAEEWVWL